VRRDSGEKSLHPRAHVVDEVRKTLSNIARDMLDLAQKDMEAGTVTVDTLDNLPAKMIRTGWCGGEECGRDIEARSNKNILGTPIDGEKFEGVCVICGKVTDRPVYLADAM